MFQYVPVKEFLSFPGLGAYQSFGLMAYQPFGRESIFVSDVSVDSFFVSKLAYLCTKEQLDPIHLLDVVLDSI